MENKNQNGFVAALRAFAQKARAALCGLIKKLKARLADARRDAEDGELFVERKKPRPFPLAVLFTTFKVLVVMIVLIGCGMLGLGMGVAKAYVDTTAELDISRLTKSDRTSYIYDKDGSLITTFAGMEYRDWVDIEEIPDMLKNAIVAIEDIRFYKHDGLDYKRLFSAVVSTFTNENTHGGSTLTQQLIKNKILSNEQSYRRKIQEAYLAVEVEQLMEKDGILEAYLNDVFLGGSNYGVKTAAKDYFGKELSALTIRECAMLAGMVQRPYETGPRTNMYSRELNDERMAELTTAYESGAITEVQYKYSLNSNCCMYKTDKRTNTVLYAMYTAGMITGDQYETALNDTVSVLEKSEQTQIYDMPYFVEYGIRDVVTHLLAKRELIDTTANRSAIENELRTGGYHIYLTVDTDMQHLVQDTLANWEEYPELANPAAAVKMETNSDGTTLDVVQPQAAAVVIDQSTGELRAIVGGRTSPERKKQWNRAYMSATQIGSSIKPLAVYGPAIDLGASPASVVLNFPSKIEGWDSEKGYPYIGNSKWIGPITLRRGVVSSLNVAAARTLLERVGFSASAQYLEKLGIDPSRISQTGAGLALGTMGITPVEMAAAYATVANGGVYIEPLSFTRVLDSDNRTVLDAAEVRDTHEVFKLSTAYMLTDVLTNAVQSGTGTRAKIDGMTVAGKTGTNSDYQSVYFSGITPYYTATVWIGHDNYVEKLKSGSEGGKYAAPLWQAFMSKILEGYADRPIIDVSTEEAGVVKRTVCAVSGKVATAACFNDGLHPPVTDWFEKGTAPTEECDMHSTTGICAISGEIASPYCPSGFVTVRNAILIHSDSPYMSIDPAVLAEHLQNIVYTDVGADSYTAQQYGGRSLCHIHNIAETEGSEDLTATIESANALVQKVDGYLAVVQELSETDRATLKNAKETLSLYVNAQSLSGIKSAYDQLKYTYDVIYEANPPPVTTDE